MSLTDGLLILLGCLAVVCAHDFFRRRLGLDVDAPLVMPRGFVERRGRCRTEVL